MLIVYFKIKILIAAFVNQKKRGASIDAPVIIFEIEFPFGL